MLRRVGAWSLRAVLGVAALVVVIALLTRQPGDPALYPPSANESAVEIAVVSHGYHTGLALPRALVLGEAGRHRLWAKRALPSRRSAVPEAVAGGRASGFRLTRR